MQKELPCILVPWLYCKDIALRNYGNCFPSSQKVDV